MLLTSVSGLGISVETGMDLSIWKRKCILYYGSICVLVRKSLKAVDKQLNDMKGAKHSQRYFGIYCRATISCGAPSKCPDVKCLAGTVRQYDPIGAHRCYNVATNTANGNAANLNCTSTNIYC